MTWLIRFECVEHPWNGGVIIFEDGQAKLYRHRLSPERPVLIQLEGLTPTDEQILMCRHLWARLYEEMDFRMTSFCPALLPHSQEILAPIVENIPA